MNKIYHNTNICSICCCDISPDNLIFYIIEGDLYYICSDCEDSFYFKTVSEWASECSVEDFGLQSINPKSWSSLELKEDDLNEIFITKEEFHMLFFDSFHVPQGG